MKGKIYQLCASNDLGASRGYLQYRAGRKGKIELAYPSELKHPRGVFKFRPYARNAGLIFKNGQYEYELFDALIGGSELRINRTNGKSISTLSCEERNETLTDTSTFNLFKEVGIYE